MYKILLPALLVLIIHKPLYSQQTASDFLTAGNQKQTDQKYAEAIAEYNGFLLQSECEI